MTTLAALTVRALRSMAALLRIVGRSAMRKGELIAAIEATPEEGPQLLLSAPMWDCDRANPVLLMLWDEGIVSPACAACAATYARHYGAQRVRALPTGTPILPSSVLTADDEIIRHLPQGHDAGYLYDCPACEAQCHCTPGHAECVYSAGPHNGQADYGTSALCPVTGQPDCRERSCELHYDLAPLRIAAMALPATHTLRDCAGVSDPTARVIDTRHADSAYALQVADEAGSAPYGWASVDLPARESASAQYARAQQATAARLRAGWDADRAQRAAADRYLDSAQAVIDTEWNFRDLD